MLVRKSCGISNNPLRHYRNFLIACYGGPDTFTLPHHRLVLRIVSIKYLGLPSEKGGYTLAMKGGGLKFYIFSVGQMGPNRI
jgi:hypothetical protein